MVEKGGWVMGMEEVEGEDEDDGKASHATTFAWSCWRGRHVSGREVSSNLSWVHKYLDT